MHTYARGFTCIRRRLKEKVLWGAIMLPEIGKQTNKLKSLLFLPACKFCLLRILRTLRE